jgi:polyhydroxyalkanoate synthesis repressor PhaR
MNMKSTSSTEPIVIKKYANRRLYNTETSSYVTLEYLSQMVKEDKNFVVKDAKTGEDITRSVLTQIIFEEENKGQTLLPINFLRQLISFYGGGLQEVIPNYLESTMAVFAQNQERYRKYIEENFTAAAPFAPPQDFMAPFQEMARQNMQAFEKATSMFVPFVALKEGETAPEGDKQAKKAAPASALEILQSQLAAMQKQIDALSGKK